jgi:hypothetical protein
MKICLAVLELFHAIDGQTGMVKLIGAFMKLCCELAQKINTFMWYLYKRDGRNGVRGTKDRRNMIFNMYN